MKFNGEIVFDIADMKQIEVDFGTDILPTRVINKDDIVALGRKAPKFRWMYEIKFSGEKEYLVSLEKMINLLCKKREYVNYLTRIYDEVSINVYIRSDFAEIGYSLPNHLFKKCHCLSVHLILKYYHLVWRLIQNLQRIDMYGE